MNPAMRPTIQRWEVESFTHKHREMDVAYYGKPYDDQDKYQLIIKGEKARIVQFLEELKQESPHPYIRFSSSLLNVHLTKVHDLKAVGIQSYALTLYHVGSRHGQLQELRGWLNWMKEKESLYSDLSLQLQFKHISNQDIFVIESC